jgi:nucleoside-diphosphate-sugar epimerase
MTSPAHRLFQNGWSVAITGASGWMGQALLEWLEPAFADEYSSRIAAFGSQPRALALSSGRIVQTRFLAAMEQLPPGKWLLVHSAYGTRDKVSVQGQDAFISANEILTDQVTNAVRAFRPAAILFPSSGAVYAKDGMLDTDMEKNPYGVMKSQDERHFSALAAEIGARIVIPRVFNLAGPHINKWTAYALSDLIVQALEGKKLQINSAGPVTRSYVHVHDIFALCLCALLDKEQKSPLIFDTRGDEDIEIADLAHRVETVLARKTRSPLRVADTGLPGSFYVGSREPMQALLAGYGLTLASLDRQIQDTADDIIRRRGDAASRQSHAG